MYPYPDTKVAELFLGAGKKRVHEYPLPGWLDGFHAWHAWIRNSGNGQNMSLPPPPPPPPTKNEQVP